MNTKDILDIVLIPLAVALLPFIWSLSATLVRRNQFRNLILREIEEISPFPLDKASQSDGKFWTDHHTEKRFLHKEILAKPTENRDFILSLPPALVYYVTQLWRSQADPTQWLYMISQIRFQTPWWQPSRRKKIEQVKNAWCELMKDYGIQLDQALC